MSQRGRGSDALGVVLSLLEVLDERGPSTARLEGASVRTRLEPVECLQLLQLFLRRLAELDSDFDESMTAAMGEADGRG